MCPELLCRRLAARGGEAARAAAGRLVEIRTGHLPLAERPEVRQRLITGFLDRQHRKGG
ncbi:hypothetical protein [Streptomyces sp. NPDC059668]|uniref:hypothetical protein n=1 Tax=Streptomyces sp. NPDC059668 TaxID=3346900 RepID=UPI00368AA794